MTCNSGSWRQQTTQTGPVVGQCWTNVNDVDPALTHRCYLFAACYRRGEDDSLQTGLFMTIYGAQDWPIIRRAIFWMASSPDSLSVPNPGLCRQIQAGGGAATPASARDFIILSDFVEWSSVEYDPIQEAYIPHPAITKHLYNIYTMLGQRRRRWADVVWMIYKCFVFARQASIG